jgi:hypothetical protein
MLFAVAFLLQFVVGGLSGVTFAVVPIDWQMTDSYYVVAHFHYVLFGGTAFAVMAAVYYWFPKMSGRLLDERMGRVHFWLMVVGFNLTFFVQHFLGLLGMPRRVYTYPDLPHWGALNMASTVGAFTPGLTLCSSEGSGPFAAPASSIALRASFTFGKFLVLRPELPRFVEIVLALAEMVHAALAKGLVPSRIGQLLRGEQHARRR